MTRCQQRGTVTRPSIPVGQAWWRCCRSPSSAKDEPPRRWKRTAPSARGVVGTAKVPRADQITGAMRGRARRFTTLPCEREDHPIRGARPVLVEAWPPAPTEAAMTSRQDFTNEEWTRIRRAPSSPGWPSRPPTPAGRSSWPKRPWPRCGRPPCPQPGGAAGLGGPGHPGHDPAQAEPAGGLQAARRPVGAEGAPGGQ
jgi:hypothetical protein